MAFPPHEEVENTLLCFIYRHGGSKHEGRASDTYGPLAHQFQLSAAEHTQSFSQQDGPKWNEIVQQARNRLYESGYLDPTAPPGVWRLSAEGIAEAERICSQEARLADPDDIEVNIAAQPDPLSSNITLRNFAPFTENHLRAMGGLIQAWNELEATVEEGIWGLGNFPKEQGRLVTFDMFIDRRIKILQRLAHHRFTDEQLRTQVDDITGKIMDLKTPRNDIVHATWETSETPGSALAIKYVSYKPSERDINVREKSYTAQEIEEIGGMIAEATMKLRTFLIDHGVVPLP